MTERDDLLRERAALRARYGPLFDQVSAALLGDDPMGIAFETNTDEYEPEVGMILPKLETCRSASEVTSVVHAEFVRWFGGEIAGPESRYRKVAGEIWRLWTEHQGGGSLRD